MAVPADAPGGLIGFAGPMAGADAWRAVAMWLPALTLLLASMSRLAFIGLTLIPALASGFGN